MTTRGTMIGAAMCGFIMAITFTGASALPVGDPALGQKLKHQNEIQVPPPNRFGEIALKPDLTITIAQPSHDFCVTKYTGEPGATYAAGVGFAENKCGWLVAIKNLGFKTPGPTELRIGYKTLNGDNVQTFVPVPQIDANKFYQFEVPKFGNGIFSMLEGGVHFRVNPGMRSFQESNTTNNRLDFNRSEF